MANTNTGTRKATPNTVKQAATESKKPTYTKAGPNSKGGGKNRGHNGDTRPLNLAVLQQRGLDIQEQKRQEREAREVASLARRQHHADVAFDMLEKMETNTYTRTIMRDGETTTRTITVTVTPDMRLGANAVFACFPAASQTIVNGKVTKRRVQAAVDQASLELTDEILGNERRKKHVINGFYLARRLLDDAYKAMKAEQNS